MRLSATTLHVGAGLKPARVPVPSPHMAPERPLPSRRSIRLEAFDYTTSGAYFITICTFGRRLLFTTSQLQALVKATWDGLPRHYPHVVPDAFVVMPNHVHGIIWLGDSETPKPLGEVVRAFKSFSARAVNSALGREGNPVWQRNYFEHVIRDDESLAAIQEYIEMNPSRWEEDHENPTGRPDSRDRAFWTRIQVAGSVPAGSRTGLRPAPTIPQP